MKGCGKQFQPRGVSLITFTCGKDDAFCLMCQVEEDKLELDKIKEELQ